MKKFFRIVSMLALAGGTLVYTGCTDYSADIDGLKNRVDKLENSSATLAGVSTQIESLKTLTSQLSTASNEANTAIAALKAGSASAADVAALSGKVSSLESAKSTIETAIEALKSGKVDKTDVADLISGLSGVEKTVSEIKGQVSSFQTQLDKLDASVETLKSGKADVTALETAVNTLNNAISALNTKVTALESGKASAADVTALTGEVKSINAAIEVIKTQIKDLDSSKADVTVVNKISETVDGIKTAITGINTKIEGIEERVAAAETKIKDIEEKINTKLDVNTAATTYATLEAVKTVKTDVAALETSLDALEEKYDGKIAELDAAVKAAKAAADAAQATADKALTTESFKDILGVYAEKGKLEAKIEELAGADKTNSDAIKTNAEKIAANYEEFETFADEFSGKVDALIDAALGADGKFDYSALKGDIETLNTKVASIESDIETIKKDIKAIKDAAEALTGRVKTAEDQIASLKELADKLQKLVDAANADIKELDENKADNTTVADIQTQIDAINKIIETIKSDVSGNKAWAEQTFATKTHVISVAQALNILKDQFEKAKIQHGVDITRLEELIEAAQTTAENALTTESLKAILGIYADQGKLEDAIKKLEEADSTNAEAIKKNAENYDKLVEDFDGKVEALIKAALGSSDGKYDLSKLSADIIDLQKAVETINGEIDAIWAAFDTEIRSLELLCDTEMFGKGVVEYSYFDCNAYEAKDAEQAQILTLNGVEYEFAKDAGWNYVQKEGTVIPNWPTVNIKYRVNPSSAKIDKDSKFNFLMRKVKEVGLSGDPEPEGYVGTAEFGSYDKGILTVGLSLGLDKDGVVYTSEDLENDYLLRFNLQSIRKENSTVTSDGGYLNVKKVNDVTPELYLRTKEGSDVTYSQLYEVTDGDDVLTENLLTVDFSKTLNVKDSICTYIESYQLEEEEYDEEKNEYGFSYKFEIVKYGKKGATSDFESDYATIDAETGVLTPKNSMKSFNRRPLVKVTLNDKNDNVLAVGFVPVLIDNSANHISDTVAVTMTTTDDHTKQYTGEVKLDKTIYEVVEETSASDFFSKYVLYKGGNDSPCIYVKDGDDFKKFEKIGDKNVFAPFTIAQNGESLKVTSGVNNLVYIYKQKDHKITVYVRYVLAADVDNTTTLRENDVLYVPVEITVERNLSATIGTKISQLWFGENKDCAYFNVKTPNTTAVLDNNWVTDLNSFWMGNAPKFVVSDGSTNIAYKFYFAPEQPEVNGHKLVVASQVIKYVDWVGGSVTIDENSKIVENEAYAKYDAEGSIYANNKLYADSVADGNLVATIDQDTGKVTFASTAVAKELLNSSASLPVEDVELYANIGIVLKRNVNNVVVSLGQNTVDKYYFPRPINASNDASAAVFEDSDDKSVISLFDAVDVTDWREATGSFKTLDKAWYFAYYGFNKIKIAGDIETTLGTKEGDKPIKLSDVTKKISLKHELDGTDKTATGVTISWNGSSADSNITIELGKPVANLNDIKKAFGDLVYRNSGYYVHETFKLYVPIEMTYVWGTFTFEVEITVTPTK